MIKSWKHKGLQRFFETGSASGINTNHVKRLRMRLQVIDQAEIIDDINLAGYRLHQLQGDRADTWSVTVSGNWRITFEFRDGDAYILNYEDYH
ncbi:type II toxin-antitoxin system RelE/ParE family toxin [Escherichia albertii]|uniref:type II toxin-antitoxin system RelE/ParE family toxin n=1 Tax=Escherichia albertii TaxID=208962 RepID=UPI0007431BE7|nr:type II toxin-antitoxin system RelE/ParE family toxin [Escherichia albertii]EEW0115655.1 Killer protein [Escherichia albertii]MCE7719044.1 type II toxin-antitoxin system RelE/ParE family toxin [Escherichia albertii]MCZ8854825.1 type II toxin-antitoxin system RelE/ParE family toxin [Escherichia albertii]HEB1544649.1 type II toxin-antitoxin system RelE/ParE family toxin [Escherichia albertii]